MTEGNLEKSLGKLAQEINAEHRAFVGTFRKTVEHGIRAGELLADAKKQCEHGTWLPWLEDNFEGSARTAQEYMRLYNHRDALRANTRDSAHLSVHGALKELADPRRVDSPAWQRERAIYALVEAKWADERALSGGAAVPYSREVADLHGRIDKLEEAVTPADLYGISPREWGAFRETVPPEEMDTPIAELRRKGYSRGEVNEYGFVVGGTVVSTPYTPAQRRAYEAKIKLMRAHREYQEATDGFVEPPQALGINPKELEEEV